MPDVRLRTTLIAGFPGETEDDLELLLGFLEAARFDYVGVFAYSPEDGTEAAIPPGSARRRGAHGPRAAGCPTRPKRSARSACSTSSARRWTCWSRASTKRVDRAVAEPVWVGRWRGQAPEIDGAVYLDRAGAG